MSDVKVEVERKETLTRRQAADRLATLAGALAGSGHAEFTIGADTFKVHVPDHVRCEVEVEVDGDEVELEVELKWSTAAPKAAPAAKKAPKPAAKTAAKPATKTARKGRTTKSRVRS